MPQWGFSTFLCRNRGPPLFHTATKDSTFSCRNKALHFTVPQRALHSFPCRNRGSFILHALAGALHFSTSQSGLSTSLFQYRWSSLTCSWVLFSMPHKLLFISPRPNMVPKLLHAPTESLRIFMPQQDPSTSSCCNRCSLLHHAATGALCFTMLK